MHRLRWRIRLHHEILRRSRYAILIRPIVHDWSLPAEVVMRWRSRSRPLKRRRVPRVVAGLRTFEHAPEQIDHENELRRDRDERRVRHESLQWQQLSLIRNLGELRIAPR